MPQIDLMMSDLPHTLYRKPKGEKGPKGPTQEDIDEATRLFEEAQKRKSGHTVEDIFNGADEE